MVAVFSSSFVFLSRTRTREQSIGLATAGATRPLDEMVSMRDEKRSNEKQGTRGKHNETRECVCVNNVLKKAISIKNFFSRLQSTHVPLLSSLFSLLFSTRLVVMRILPLGPKRGPVAPTVARPVIYSRDKLTYVARGSSLLFSSPRPPPPPRLDARLISRLELAIPFLHPLSLSRASSLFSRT